MEKAKGFLSGKQYGFTRAKSAEDTATKLRNITDACERNYVLGIFLNIEEAFDSMWQPGILESLLEIECSTNIVSVVKDYFTNRRVCVTSEFGTVMGEIDRAAPRAQFWRRTCGTSYSKKGITSIGMKLITQTTKSS